MPVTHACTACGHAMTLPDRYAGRELFCTACSARFVVPGDAPPSCGGCGTKLAPATRFCPTCGAPTGLVPPPAIRRPGAVTVLAVLYFIASGLYLLASAAFSFAPAEPGEPSPRIVAAVLAVLGLVAGALGSGLWRLRPWARRVAIAFSVIGLLGFPIGTLISILVLVYLFSAQAKAVFSGKPPAELGPAEVAALERRSGFPAVAAAVVAVVLVGVAVLGIIAAIAIPNLLNAIQRGREKRTMVDMVVIRDALEGYAAYHGRYPSAVSSIEELTGHLEPDFIPELPRVDGWSRPFEFRSQPGGDGWELASLGRDGEAGPRPGGETTDFDSDLVLDTSGWRQWPRGIEPR